MVSATNRTVAEGGRDPATEHPATARPVPEDPATDLATTDPATTDLATTDPATTDPATTERPGRFAAVRRALAILAPVAVAVALVVAVVLLLRGVGVLGSWSEIYGPSGRFVVDECATGTERFAARAACSGELFIDEGSGVASLMIGPKASFGSAMPQSGAEVDAYYQAGSPGRSFPLEARPTELARVIVGLVPLVFVVGGLASWLVGWALTRRINIDEAQRNPFSFALPSRFALRPRGLRWASVGLAWFAFDQLLVGDLLGTAGLG